MPSSQSFRRRAFSLIEMLVVVAIIGLLAAVLVPRIGGAFSNSQVKTTTGQLASLDAAVEEFNLTMGRYPTEEEGLKALVEKPATADENWRNFLGKRTVPVDGWGNEFVYKRDATGTFAFVIVSYGADGKPGGEGLDADLDNRQ